MKVSQCFFITGKENPSEAHIVSHRLMLRAGLIYQICNGIYSWLPFGLRVLENIQKIITFEHDKIHCNKVLLPTIQPAKLWQESGRYDAYGKEMLRIKDRHDKDMLYSPTHEEAVTDIARQFIKSYKQLPVIFYQIGWKFRDEIRPRFGVMRAREFLMEDAYSFDLTYEGAIESYKKIFVTYIKIFEKMGLKAIPVRADPGAIGGNLSHEFHIIAETGESQLFYDASYDDFDGEMNYDNLNKFYSACDETHDPEKCPVANLKTARGIEVGHVFYFGDKYSKSMGLNVIGEGGKPFFPEMGSYGIGVSRLVGAFIEASHDEDGIIWSEAVAPFKVAIITVKPNNDKINEIAEDLYNKIQEIGLEVLFDDRNERAGCKFSDIDLIGIPHQIILGDKAEKGVFEWKDRKTKERKDLDIEGILRNVSEIKHRLDQIFI